MNEFKRKSHCLIVLFILIGLIIISSGFNFFINRTLHDNLLNKKSSANKVLVTNSNNFKINSGLLLGLVKDNGAIRKNYFNKSVSDDYRTLWIYSKDSVNLNYKEMKDEIITPYIDKFWVLKNSKFRMFERSDDISKETGDVFQGYISFYNFLNILSYPIDKPKINLLTNETFKKNYLSSIEGDLEEYYKTDTESLSYVGNKFVNVVDSYIDTGGGSYSSSFNDIKLYDIKDIGDLKTRKKTTNTIDLLDKNEKEKLNKYVIKYKKTSPNELTEESKEMNLNELALKRINGRWKIQIPLFDTYIHNGNGSSGYNLERYIDTNVKVPDIIKCYDNLCIDWSVIKKKIQNAKDAVSSPQKDILVVLTTNELLVYVNPLNGIDKPNFKIKVDKNESIILNQWAIGKYAKNGMRFWENRITIS